jgi:hypothetical protein
MGDDELDSAGIAGLCFLMAGLIIIIRLALSWMGV